jgi:hypothetical protein
MVRIWFDNSFSLSQFNGSSFLGVAEELKAESGSKVNTSAYKSTVPDMNWYRLLPVCQSFLSENNDLDTVKERE